MHNAGFKRVEDLQATVDKLTLNIQRARAKILGIELPPLEVEVITLAYSTNDKICTITVENIFRKTKIIYRMCFLHL